MRAKEFTNEARKPKPLKAGDTTPHDYDPGWQLLNDLKSLAQHTGRRLADTYQLFVPRRNPMALTSRDKRLKNLANKYAWDDEGNLKPEYEKWEKGIAEGAPILAPGKTVSPPGNNKPSASLWTSTARKVGDGWTSEWAQWTESNQPTWFSTTGYLYKVKPGALILELDNDHDAQDIMWVFQSLNRVKEPEEPNNYGRDVNMRLVFPWDEISKNFAGVHHSGYGYGNEFMYGWDVESTAWFDTSVLQLIGEVPVVSQNRDDD